MFSMRLLVAEIAAELHARNAAGPGKKHILTYRVFGRSFRYIVDKRQSALPRSKQPPNTQWDMERTDKRVLKVVGGAVAGAFGLWLESKIPMPEGKRAAERRKQNEQNQANTEPLLPPDPPKVRNPSHGSMKTSS
ncbi:hypothetical protein PG996_011339 [Apiospora saccharicola]|uniref:Uncharacterized protein n=1 Tax=Apiospora saccharicola TaxID=335842 RepID=A0ABR1UES4_9PEZI